MIEIVIIALICWTVEHCLDEILEQRRRETKTGEFEEQEEQEDE